MAPYFLSRFILLWPVGWVILWQDYSPKLIFMTKIPHLNQATKEKLQLPIISSHCRVPPSLVIQFYWDNTHKCELLSSSLTTNLSWRFEGLLAQTWTLYCTVHFIKCIKISADVSVWSARLKDKRRAWAVALERASWDLWAVSSSNQDFSSSIHLRRSITNWALPAVGRLADHRLPWLQHRLKQLMTI